MSVEISERELIDAALRHNLVPDNYFTGWRALCDWQLAVLKAAGMRPEHHLLDVGCGAMRLGLAAVDYLDDGRYCGTETYGAYVELARELARKVGLTKSFQLAHDAEFPFDRFGCSFDFAMAQSVFTHLSLPQMERCMAKMRAVMKPGGKFLFTYILGSHPTLGFVYGQGHVMQRGWIDDEQFLADLGRRHGATFQPYLPQPPHPTGQSTAIYAY